MLTATILLKDVLTQISTLDSNGKAPFFSISFRTLNRNSKTGGRLVLYPKAKLATKEIYANDNSVEALMVVPKAQPKFRKPPNHFDNKTRNIVVMPRKDTRKVHINYITEFNGKKVVY